MISLAIAGFLWSTLLVALILTIVRLTLRSWRLLWVAFALSLVFTVAAALSIGPLILLLDSLLLGCAVALRRSMHWRGWIALISTAVLIWFLVVPFQLLVIRFIPLDCLIPMGLVAAIVATLTAPPTSADSSMPA